MAYTILLAKFNSTFWLPICHQEWRLRYYASWRCDRHYYGQSICLPEVRILQSKQLLPICCQYIYTNFTSEVGDVICIIVASLFISYPSTCLERWRLLAIFYIMITKSLHFQLHTWLPSFYVLPTKFTIVSFCIHWKKLIKHFRIL